MPENTGEINFSGKRNPPLRISPEVRIAIGREMRRLSLELDRRITFAEMVSMAWDAYVELRKSPSARVQISDSERTVDVSAETLDLVKGLDALLASTDEKNTLLAKWLKAELLALRPESE